MLPANSSYPRRIALVDCNNFYVSCERVFHPAWNKRPVGVLSNNDGCIIARSNELKSAGIPMGAPYFKHKKQLEAMKAVVVSSNYALYGDMSARVMHTMGQYAPDIEVYSIDEAWLDLTGIRLDELDALGREISIRTYKNTGIPVSMGIGPTKTLAKIANRICKKHDIPGRIFNISSADSLDAVLAGVAVADIWGIGRRLAEKLNKQRIFTALDLRNTDAEGMRSRYSVVMQRLILELRGIACLDKEDVKPKQQIIASRSFGARVTSKYGLVEAVALHATRAGEKLRAQHSACGALQVSIRSGQHNIREPYFSNSCTIRFPTPTADTRQLITAASNGINRIFKPGIRYAKAGVMLFDIIPRSQSHKSLFDTIESTASSHLMATIDSINHQFGKHTLFFAAEGTHKMWAMKRSRMTQAFTTQWNEIPLVG
ncbi:MAG: Y-family DNA polymerase [Burkholderiales bacterium]|nr:Y-family DNA polymerase [Nitrosomonas sp.]MCP5245890.1 Y-family DNA polymerase [Burkholderiales bacterium]MCP5276713.1 Y-family DNA polymerase [Burkholderiales bacterium]MCP5303615.1 Y-family DNA polymerase [Pseudomonadales bacterium]